MATNAPADPMNVPRILWAALFASTFMYLYVYYTAAPRDVVPDQPIMPYVLAGVALACAVVSFVLPASFQKQAAARAKLDVKEIPDPNASVMFRDHTPTIRVFADPAAARKKAMQLYFVPLILALAMTEAIAVFGLVLGFLGWGSSVVLPFFAAAWLLYLPRFPRLRVAVAPLEKAHDARLVDDGVVR